MGITDTLKGIKNYVAKGASKITNNQYVSKMSNYVKEKAAPIGAIGGATAASYLSGSMHLWSRAITEGYVPTSFPNAPIIAEAALAGGLIAYGAKKGAEKVSAFIKNEKRKSANFKAAEADMRALGTYAYNHSELMELDAKNTIAKDQREGRRSGENYKAARADMNALGTYASDNAKALQKEARDITRGDRLIKRGYNAAKKDMQSFANYASADSTRREQLGSEKVSKSMKDLQERIRNGEKELASLYKNSVIGVDAVTSEKYRGKLDELRGKEAKIKDMYKDFVSGKSDYIGSLHGDKIYKENVISEVENRIYDRLRDLNGQMKVTKGITKDYAKVMQSQGFKVDADQILGQNPEFKKFSLEINILKDDLQRLESLKAKK